MADKLFKDYFLERAEDTSIVDNSKILINRGNSVRKIDVNKFASADDLDNYVDLTTDQNISGVKTFNDDLGIGTTNPEHSLHVVSSEQCPALFESEITGGGIALMDSTTTDDQQVGIGAFGDHLCFRSGGAPSGNMRLLSNGNLGIGTTTPSDKLTIQTSAGSLNGLTLKDSGGNDAAKFNINPSTGEIKIGSSRVNYFPTFYSNNSEAMRITSAGNVGIGTTNPAAKLDVNGNTKITGTLDLNDGSSSVKIGTLAGGTGINQTSVGHRSGQNSQGINQSAFGLFSGYFNEGNNQSAFGMNAGRDNSGANQTAAGYEAGRDNTGDNNIAIGFESSEGNSGDDVLSIGYQAGKGNTQSNRTIIDNDLLPAFASFALAEAAFGSGQSGMTYLYFNTVTNTVEGVRF